MVSVLKVTLDELADIGITFFMPEGHPLFLFSVRGPIWVMRGSQFSPNKWCYFLMDWDET